MAKQKKEKQLTPKQQIYQQIANYQVQQALGTPQNNQQNAMKSLQAEYDQWAAKQSLQSEYNNWLKAQQPQQTNTAKASVPKVEPIKFATAEERKAMHEKQQFQKDAPFDEVKSYANTYAKQRQDQPKTIQQSPELENYLSAFEGQKREDVDMNELLARHEQRNANLEKARAYLDTGKKLTKDELKKARLLAAEGMMEFEGKRYKDLSTDEKIAYDTFNDLHLKTSALKSYGLGALKGGLTTLQNIGNLILTANQANAPTSQALDIQRQNIADYKKKVEEDNAVIAPIVENAKTQHPLAFGAGQLTEKGLEYASTNGLFEAGALAKGGGKLAQFAANQLGENAQDIVLDTLPLYMNIAEDSSLTDEQKADIILKNLRDNAIGNAVAYGILNYLPGKIGQLVRNGLDQKAANEAFRTNALEGLDKMQKVNQGYEFGYHNSIPEVVARNADDITESSNMQLKDLMAQYNNEFKDTTAMKNIYSPEDLDNSLNKQLEEALKNDAENFVPTKYLYSDGTKQYPTERVKVLSVDKNNVINNGNNIDDFINAAKKDKRYNAKFHYALPSDELSKDIMNGTNRDLSNYSIVLSGDRVRHDLKQHGKTSEVLRGQEVIEPENMKDFIKAFNNPDSVENVMELDANGILKQAFDNENRPLIKFTKRVNGKSHVVIGVSDGKKNLYVDTYYMTKSKKNPSTTVNDIKSNIPSSTSKTFRGIDSFDLKVTNSNPKVNENAVNTLENVSAATKQKLGLPDDVSETMASDLMQIRDASDKMRIAAEATGNATAIEKYNKLSDSIENYEKALYYSDDLEEVKAAKRATDAARQSLIREIQKTDPNYKGELTGTKIGNAEYRRTSMKVADEEAQKLADSIVESENALNSSKNVPGANPLQTFADGTPKEEWKTGRWRTNTAEKIGNIKNPDDLPLKDYGYRVFHELEQHEAAKARYADSKDIVSDLIHNSEFDEVDMKAAMDEYLDLMEKGDSASLKKARRLSTKIDHEGREGGRTIQALAEYTRNTPAGQVREAQSTINQAIDKRVGKGTSEALDNLYGEIADAFENATSKEDFLKEVKDFLDGDLKEFASSGTAKTMKSKRIKGADKIIKMIDNAESLEDVPFDQVIDALYKSNGSVALSAKTQHEVYKMLKEAATLDPQSYKYKVLQAKAARKVMAEVPAGLGDYIRTFLYDNMLGNFKTAFSRNFLGNVAYQTLEKAREPISAVVDKAVSLKTGKRSTLGWNAEKVGSYVGGFKKGAAEQAGDTFKYSVNTTRSGQEGFAEALKNNRTVHNDNKTLGHLANQVDLYVEQAMKFGDRPVYEANYAEYKTELEQMLQKYGKNGVAGLENVKDADLPEVVDKIAQVRAADAVFQKQGLMSEGLTKLRDGLGDLSRGAFGIDVLSTASAPFTLTPGNMLEKALEYTPAGFIKNGIQTAIELNKGGFDQRRFVDTAGRSILGLPVLYAAYQGAKNGLINGGYSDDTDERAAQQEDGYIEYGLNVPENIPVLGGKTLDTSDLPVYGPFMQAGSVLAENGLSPEASLQAAEAVLGGSATQGIRRAFGAEKIAGGGNNGLVKNFVNTVKSSGSQAVPSLLRQTAQTMDPYKRDLGEYGTNEYYLNLVKNSIPGLRQTMPIKTNVEGEEVLQNQGRGLGSKILENYVLPMNVSEYDPSPLNQEASRLLEATDSAIAFTPKALRKDMRAWDKKAGIDYSEDQFRAYKQEFGKLNSEAGNAVINSEFYNSMDDSEKAKTLQNVYSAMKQVAKYNATGIETDDKIANAYMEGGLDGMLNYIQGKDLLAQYDIKSNSKAGKAALEQAASGNMKAAESTLKEAAQAKADKAAGKTSTTSTASKSTSTEDKAKAVFKEDFGSNGSNVYKQYQAAKSIDPTTSSATYRNTYKRIDSLGDSNGSVNQKEFIQYLNNGNYTEAEAQKMASMYGSWTKIPKLENGTWKFKKK